MIGVAAFLVSQANPTARDLPRLIGQIRAVYKTCKTYRDTGSQTIWVQDKNGERTPWGKWMFSTLFLRPGHLRCEVSEPAKGSKHRITSVLWTVKEPGRKPIPLSDSLQPTSYPISIYTGLDGSSRMTDDFVAGISSFASLCFGIVDKVPCMLLPTEVVPGDLAVNDLRWVGPEKVGTHSCFVLSSKELTTKFWFDNQTKLLIKLSETQDFGDGRSSIKLIQYSPQINTPISESIFKGPRSGKLTPDKPPKEPRQVKL